MAKSPQDIEVFYSRDLDLGLPSELPTYDMIVSCEGIEHFSNPGLFLSSALRHLKPNGIFVVTTPNTWHPTARLKYFTRGTFPGFPVLAGRIKRGTHMHIMPWSWPQLYLHLSLAGFTGITLHPCVGKSRQWLEKILGFGLKSYSRKRKRKTSSEEEWKFWDVASTSGALFSGQLVVSARRPQPQDFLSQS